MPARAIRRAADDLQFFLAGIDGRDFQPVGLRMFFGRQHMRDDEGRERFAGIARRFDLKPERGELVADRRQAMRWYRDAA